MISMNLRALRKSAGLTMEDVADRIGVSRQSVAKWENNEGMPDIGNCQALAALYDVTLDDLVKGHYPEGVVPPPKGKYIFGTVTVGERGQIVIPVRARKIFDIHPGDQLVLLGDTHQGGLAILKASMLAQQLEYMLAQTADDESDPRRVNRADD